MRLKVAFSRKRQRLLTRLLHVWSVHATRGIRTKYEESNRLLSIQATLSHRTGAVAAMRNVVRMMFSRKIVSRVLRWKRRSEGYWDGVRAHEIMRRVGRRWKDQNIADRVSEWRRRHAQDRQKSKAQSSLSRVHRRWMGYQMRKHVEAWRSATDAGYQELLQARRDERHEVAVTGTQLIVRMLDNGMQEKRKAIAVLCWAQNRLQGELRACQANAQKYLDAFTQLETREAVMMRVRLSEMEVERGAWDKTKESLKSELSATRAKCEADIEWWQKKVHTAENDMNDAVKALTTLEGSLEKREIDHQSEVASMRQKWSAEVAEWRQEAAQQREEVTKMWQAALQEKADLLAAHVREQQATEARWVQERGEELAVMAAQLESCEAETRPLKMRIEELEAERASFETAVVVLVRAMTRVVDRSRKDALNEVAEADATITKYERAQQRFMERLEELNVEHLL